MKFLRHSSMCGVVFAVAIAPREARACSVAAPPPDLRGMPTDGDVAVPTDVVPFYDWSEAGLTDDTKPSAQFILTSDLGEMIPLTARWTYVWDFELYHEMPLRPLTRYTLHGAWITGDQTQVTANLSFTTGNGALGAAPPSPAASMSHYAYRGSNLTTCDIYPNGSCVSFPADTTVVATYVDSFGQELGWDSASNSPGQGAYLYARPFFTNLSGIDQGTNFLCVKLRERGANSKLSDPVSFCGKDAPLYDLDTSPRITCTAAGLTQDGQPVQQGELSGGGCSVSRRLTRAWDMSLGLLVAAIVLGERRKRAQGGAHERSSLEPLRASRERGPQVLSVREACDPRRRDQW